MKRVTLLLVSFVCIVQLKAQETTTPAERQAKALSVVAKVDYGNIITQHAKSGDAPMPGDFKGWLLMEVNNNSLLRDQIAEDVDAIESNGRNGNFLESFLTTNGEYLGRLVFYDDDVKVSRVKGGKEVFTYQASFLTEDHFRGGMNEIEFVFTFKVKVEPFEATKAYQVTVVSYPRFVKKNEKEVENR